MSSALKSHRPMDRCFANVIILDKILNHVSEHPMRILQLRLVNKACNIEILHRIRRAHREIKIERSVHHYTKIIVNNHLFDVEKTAALFLFRFLIEVANVRVEKLELDLWGFWRTFRKPFHDTLIQVLLKNQTPRVLTGMNEICEEGCSECIRHALGCQEYGPMQFEALKAFKNTKLHFKKLIVQEAGLRDITNHCRKNSESREQCLEMMKDLINGNLSCDHLQLSLAENPAFCPTEYLRFGPLLPQALPLELLVQMCTAWKVRTVGIDIEDSCSENVCYSNTEEKPFFTEFQFNNPYEQTPRSTGFLLDHVELDLERATYSDGGVFGGNMPQIDNLLPNIRRLFPAKHYYVNNYKWMEMSNLAPDNDYTISTNKVTKIIDAAFKGTNQNDASMTCRYYTLVNSVSMYCEIPKTIWIGDRLFEITVLPSTITDSFPCITRESVLSKTFNEYVPYERVAKTFRITDSVSGSVLDLEIYVNKNYVAFQKYDGFLQHYNNL